MRSSLIYRNASRKPRFEAGLFRPGRGRRLQNRDVPYRDARSFSTGMRRNGRIFLKRTGVRAALGILGRALQSASKSDPDIREELRAFPEGFTVVMKVWPSGPGITLQKQAGALRYRNDTPFDASLTIYFKSLAAAWPLLTPQVGPAQGFAEHRMAVRGDLGCAMVFTRCLNTLLACLYPAWVSRRLLKRRPPMSLYKQWIRLKIVTAGVLFGR